MAMYSPYGATIPTNVNVPSFAPPKTLQPVQSATGKRAVANMPPPPTITPEMAQGAAAGQTSGNVNYAGGIPTGRGGGQPQPSPYNAPGAETGSYAGDQWTAGSGGYPVANPALNMPPGPARNKAEDRWKTQRNSWIGKTKGGDALNKFKDQEHGSFQGGADRVAEERRAAREGPKYNVAAPAWDVEGFGQAQGYDVGDPYKVGGIDPLSKVGRATYGDQSMIQRAEMGEQERVSPYSMSAQNFNPYRRQALGDVDRTTAGSLASAESALARTGGLSSADRMALASQANRQKIEGRQGALGRIDMMEAQNRFGTQAANIGALNRGQEFNVGAANQRSMAKYGIESGMATTEAGEANRRQADIYGADTTAERLDASAANRRAERGRELTTGAARDAYGAGQDARKFQASEQNLRDRASVDARNKKAAQMAMAKYGRDSEEYRTANQQFILGKQLDYGEIASGNLYDQAGKGSGNWLEKPTLKPVNEWLS